MKRPPVLEKNVLITGCSSGIGLATARHLRQHGWNVLPTARKPEDLSMLRGEGFAPVRLDVTDEKSVTDAAAQALQALGGNIGALVNNAGFGQPGAAEDLTRELLAHQMNVNFIGMHDLTTRIIPSMRTQGCGRIVNVSSVLGRIIIPFHGAYCASKFAMEALTDAMRVELWNTGIGVTLVEPGPIISDFRQNAADRTRATMVGTGRRFEKLYEDEIRRRENQQKKPRPFTLPPEAVAEKILHALESPAPKRRYRVTVQAHLGYWAARLAPEWFVDWMNRRDLPDA